MHREKLFHRLRQYKQWKEETKRKEESGELFCKDCGSSLKKEHDFCPKCGKILVGKQKVGEFKRKENYIRPVEIENVSKEEFKTKEKEERIKPDKEINAIEIKAWHVLLVFVLILVVGLIIKNGIIPITDIFEKEGDNSGNLDEKTSVVKEDPGTTIPKTFDKYPGITFYVNSNVIHDYTDAQKLKTRPWTERTEFLTSDKENIRNLAKQLEVKAEEEGKDPIKYIIKFVQDLDYIYDTRTGYDEFPKYPEETIWAQNGDCEDTSYVLYSLLESLGYDVALVHIPDHAMVAIACTPTELCGNHYWGWKNKAYYLIESTAGNGELGVSIEVSKEDIQFIKNPNTDNYNELVCFQKEITSTRTVPLSYNAKILYKNEPCFAGFLNVASCYQVKIENTDNEMGIFEYELGATSGDRNYKKTGQIAISAHSSEEFEIKLDTSAGEIIQPNFKVAPSSKEIKDVDYETHCK